MLKTFIPHNFIDLKLKNSKEETFANNETNM